MAKVLLIDPPWHALQNQDNSLASLGLAYLGAYLRKNNHECLIYNGDFGFKSDPQKNSILTDYDYYLKNLNPENPIIKKTFEEIESILKTFNPSYVGITIPTAKYLVAKIIAEKIKTINPKIKIIVGGPHPTCLPEKTVLEPCFDVVVRREGEIPFLNIIETLEKNSTLLYARGIVFKVYNKPVYTPEQEYIEDLDSLPFPAWDLFYKYKEHHPDSFGALITSRGCPYNCTFCASKTIWARKTRNRSVKKIVEEIKYTNRNFNTTTFRINDDTFTLNKDRIVDFCNSLINEKLKIKWACDTRANHVDLELLKLMKKAGCIQVNFGIESGNLEILKSIDKGIDLAQVKNAISLAKKAGITTVAYFMMGFPRETKAQVWDTINLMDELKVDHPLWGVVTPYPGTAIYAVAKEKGLLPKDDNWSHYFHHSPDMGLSESLSKEDINELMGEIQKRLDIINKKNDIKRKFNRILHPIDTSKKIKYRVELLFKKITF